MKHLLPHERLLELDALRGIAASMVVFFHLTVSHPPYDKLFKWGVTGVDLFFIISGFVILMTLERTKSSSEFVLGRAVRLYPTYWASVVFTFSVMIWQAHKNNESWLELPWIKMFANLTMFQHYLAVHHLDGPYWTLTIELVFYAFMLLLFWRKQLVNIEVIGFAVLILTTILYHVGGTHPFSLAVYQLLPLLYFFPLFYIGILYYRIWKNPSESPRLSYVLIALSFLIQFSFYSRAGTVASFLTKTEYAIMLAIYYSVFTLFIQGRLKVLVNKPLVFLGKISYALYVVHQYVLLAVINPYFIEVRGMNKWVVFFLISYPIAIILATLITYLIERPIMRWWKSKFSTKKASTSTVLERKRPIIEETFS